MREKFNSPTKLNNISTKKTESPDNQTRSMNEQYFQSIQVFIQ